MADAAFAAGFFRRRCRGRNPAVVASKSGLVLLELDGPDPALEMTGSPSSAPAGDGDSPQPARRTSLRLPRRTGWSAARSTRRSGATVSSDGYLIAGGSLHPSGHVYRYLDDEAELAELPDVLYDRLVELGEQTRERRRGTQGRRADPDRAAATRRSSTLALERVRAASGARRSSSDCCRRKRTRRSPPLAEELVRKQTRRGDQVGRQGTRPRPSGPGRRRAVSSRASAPGKAAPVTSTRKASGLFLPFADVRSPARPAGFGAARSPRAR